MHVHTLRQARQQRCAALREREIALGQKATDVLPLDLIAVRRDAATHDVEHRARGMVRVGHRCTAVGPAIRRAHEAPQPQPGGGDVRLEGGCQGPWVAVLGT